LHYAGLFRFALGLCQDETEAADLTQQTFYLWATKGHQLRDRSKLRSWLLTTLHREFLGAKRHENRFPHYAVESVEHELPNVVPAMVDAMDSQAVMQALLQVDELHRAPLMLFYTEDMSYKEIAETLGIATGTVMSRISRGKDQLRRLLAVDRGDAASHKVVPIPADGTGGVHGNPTG